MKGSESQRRGALGSLRVGLGGIRRGPDRPPRHGLGFVILDPPMRTRRRTAEVLLSRPLPQSKPSAAAALPFCVHGWTMEQTISCVLAHHSAKRRARRLPPERARRVSLLSLVGNVVEPGSRAVERDEGQSFGHNLCGSVPRTSRPRQGCGMFRAGVMISEDGNGPDLPPGRGSQSTGGFDIK
ncbi:MAG: hypothetical protein CJBNEKGG_01246 [Prosthecobacter sp.]|nr:hypothetical protein [Prosthecobacter sp.]